MNRAVARMMPDGQRLHLQHGPIDLVIGADGAGRRAAYAAAIARFDTILQDLVNELPLLRTVPGATRPAGKVAKRMHQAVRPHVNSTFATMMAAVAGAVADEVLAAMCAECPLERAYVNNGGDIAIHLTGGASFRLAMCGLDCRDLGRVEIAHSDCIGGIATSGQGGRSLSLGIAGSVTVLARTGAAADVAATLIANAVDLPGHPSIIREPANQIDPDSDLGDRLVVMGCGKISRPDVLAALQQGVEMAGQMRSAGLISGAALFLQGQSSVIGLPTCQKTRKLNQHA